MNEEDKFDLMIAELLDKVPFETLQKAKVSMRELSEIKKLVKFDKKIFTEEADMHPRNDLEPDNPYSFFVNF